MKWHKISEKLPEINKEILILNEKKTGIRRAKLSIYDEEKSMKGTIENYLKNGDIYWIIPGYENKMHWGLTATFPYWLSIEDIIKLTNGSEEIKNRSEILDL